MAGSAVLGDHLESYVTGLVRSGRYQSRDEVLREGVRLIEEREKRLAALDSAIARVIADAEAGRVKPIDAVGRRLVSKYKLAAETPGPRGPGRGFACAPWRAGLRGDSFS